MIEDNISTELTKKTETMAPVFTDVVVVKNNSVIVDWHNPEDKVNFIFSCTKSIISILFGILLEEHKKISLDDSIIDHLPQIKTNVDKYQAITIKNLLSMTSGIEWKEMIKANIEYNKMVKGDWLEYVLAKPIIVDNIGEFNYCDGNSLLLSAIITNYTGVPAHEYAKEVLFQPLNITKTKWKEQNGLTMGGTGLHMKAKDLAKIGYMVLNNGIYDNKGILSDKWIKAMSSIHSAGHPNWFGNYGLHWWISGKDINEHVNMFYALGAHGQYLFIIPEERLVVCIRKKVGKMKDLFLPRDFLFSTILPFTKD
jgi:CubicO group peptidase (beta-lactamase class C family)